MEAARNLSTISAADCVLSSRAKAETAGWADITWRSVITWLISQYSLPASAVAIALSAPCSLPKK
jgi:hypothetical protein